MRLGAWRYILLAPPFAATTLLACNAIVGVEDVALRSDTQGDAEGEPVTIDSSSADDLLRDKTELALGFNHTCARLREGTVRCWGDNANGAVGDGTPLDGIAKDVLEPKVVAGIGDAIAIASGVSHTCVVHEGGGVSCWGSNLFGQLGDGTQTASSVPVEVGDLRDATAISAGTSFTCALRRGGTVSCWGANHAGQLGDGRKVDRATPGAVEGLGGVASISAANEHVCAVLENGRVACWGGSSAGQLGTGGTTESGRPVRAGDLAGIVQVAAAPKFSCARSASGSVHCWGANDLGQVGRGSASNTPTLSPTAVPGLDDSTFLWTGAEHACVVRETGKVACWGRGNEAQLGQAPVVDASVPSPIEVDQLPSAVAVWTGGNRACSLAKSGRVFCWGQNNHGQLGNGERAESAAPRPVRGLP